jgi:hypothetical protein
MPVVPLEASVESTNCGLLVIIRILLVGEFHSMFERIVIEAETSGDSRSLFRLQVDGHLIGEGLTVAQVQLATDVEMAVVPSPASIAARTTGGLQNCDAPTKAPQRQFGANWGGGDRRCRLGIA